MMLLLAITDVVWQALIAAFVTVIIGWMQYKTKVTVEKASREALEKADEAAVQVKKVARRADEVKIALEETNDSLHSRMDDTTSKLAENTAITKVIHTLVNNEHGIALAAVKELSQWKANTTKNPVDVEAARKAEVALEDHLSKQSSVDNK